MIWLANIFANLVGSLAGLVGLQLAKRTIFATAAIAAALALTMAFTLGIQALLGGIVYVAPAIVQQGAYLLPSNVSACLGAIVSAKIGRAIYDYHMTTLKIAASIS